MTEMSRRSLKSPLQTGAGDRAANAPCALCGLPEALMISHIIPNAVFRRIKQLDGTGQLIQFDDSDDAAILRSQDTWTERLLCRSCEAVIAAYERYGLELLRALSSRMQSSSALGSIKNYDYRLLKLFLTSLLWRASVSKQASFRKVIVPAACEEEARRSLLSGFALRPLRLGCRIARLIDTTRPERGGFTVGALQRLVVSPFARTNSNASYYTVVFVIEGFLLEFYVQGMPFRHSGKHGLVTDAAAMLVPNVCVFSVPELVKLMSVGYRIQSMDQAPTK